MKHFTEFDPKELKLNLDSSRNKRKYCQDIFVFDMETTSCFVKDGVAELYDYKRKNEFEEHAKCAVPYIWQFSINEIVYYGRYLEEFRDFLVKVKTLTRGRKMVVYVHNLAFEFMFLTNIFTFDKVFARKENQPLYAELDSGDVIFKCSYMLSGLGLGAIPIQHNFETLKLEGDLDYNVLRNPKTPLTDKEMGYCKNDCLVVYEYIKLMMKEYGKIQKIPLTKTSKVRVALKSYIQNYTDNKWNLLNWLDKRTKNIMNLKEYIMAIEAFSGGYVHANAFYTGRVITNVDSFDYTSKYPAVMLFEKFPMTPFNKFTLKSLDDLDSDYFAYMLELELTSIECTSHVSYISSSKGIRVNGKDDKIDNGRLIKCNNLKITISEVDWEIIKENYSIGSVKIISAYKSAKDYLPIELRKFIFNLFVEKNRISDEIKKAEDNIAKFGETKENVEILNIFNVEYKMVKERINSIYGMCVTKVISDEIDFSSGAFYDKGELICYGSWSKRVLDEEMIGEKLEEMRSKGNTLLDYAWGVWITAYARRDIIGIISKMKNDFVYSDTDSAKCVGDHREMIKEENIRLEGQFRKVCEEMKVSYNEIYGLGLLEHEDHYDEFITYGAKKYCYRSDKIVKGETVSTLTLTVSGVNKKTGVKVLKDDITNLKTGLIFDEENGGPKAKRYNDEQPSFIITDYMGNRHISDYRYGICIYPTSYTLGITGDYFEYVAESDGSKFLSLL